MKQSDSKQPGSKVKSSSWTMAIVVVLVLYSILQSQQEEKKPPSHQVDLVQNETPSSNSRESTEASGVLNESDHHLKIKKEKDSPQTGLRQKSGSVASQTNSRPITKSPAKKIQTPANSNRPPPAGSSKSTAQSQPELGQLRDLGGKVWESDAGLKYGPGSREKHRLLHIMRHAEDQPRRPGKHGVFLGEGDRKKVLALIDEAYLKALKGGKNVEIKKEGSRVVYTVEMGRRVGFVGGSVGNKQGKPSASKIRLVLEGTNVITAFPL